MGVSYGGISQLFVAATRPPSLAAITPLSVIDNTQTTLYPGGILNTGFALAWAKDRVHDAQPGIADQRPGVGVRADPGRRRRSAGPTRRCTPRRSTCSPRSAATATTAPRSPTRSRRSPSSTRSRCRCSSPASGPTSRRAATARRSPSRFTGTDRKWFTFTNGVHTRLARPRDLHPLVRLPGALRRPAKPGAERRLEVAGADHLPAGMGIPGVQLPDDPIQQEPDFAAALAAFEALPPVRILFDNGAGGRARPPVCRLRAVVLELPGAEHQGALLVPARGRRPARREARRGRQGRVHVGRRARARRPTSPATPAPAPTACGPRRPRTTGRQNPAGTARLLRHPAAERRHRGGRRRGVQGLDPLTGSRPRPAGDRLRGAPRRQGELRPERLAADRRPQARPQEEHPARAGAQPAQARPRSAAARRVDEGHGAALLPGPRLSGRVARSG